MIWETSASGMSRSAMTPASAGARSVPAASLPWHSAQVWMNCGGACGGGPCENAGIGTQPSTSAPASVLSWVVVAEFEYLLLKGRS